jgi:hypothetical protein
MANANEDRERRLREALRANLRRRKGQARAWDDATGDGDESPDAETAPQADPKDDAVKP